jgi:mono/diheme cytochrome c family protein
MPFVMGATGRGARIGLADGKDLYAHICQGCHMADGKGAALGPAAYPALAGNARLAARIYPAMLVVKGQGAMPRLGLVLDDAQVAAVVNYVRGSFGNAWTDQLTPAEVAALRSAAPLKGRPETS